MKEVALFVFDGLADWEIGLITYEIQTRTNNKIITFGSSSNTIITGGGLKVLPDKTMISLELDKLSAVILPGGTIWEKEEPSDLKHVIERIIDKNIPLAAICGATLFLAKNNFLECVKHTSNSKKYLLEKAGMYKGHENYQVAPSVINKNIITANGQFPIDFAANILKSINIYKEETIEEFLWFWKQQEPSE
jgi:putative intracellular protease/amidase